MQQTEYEVNPCQLSHSVVDMGATNETVYMRVLEIQKLPSAKITIFACDMATSTVCLLSDRIFRPIALSKIIRIRLSSRQNSACGRHLVVNSLKNT
jgi:hypothetical protein